MRRAYNILVGKSEGKRSLTRCWNRLEDYIKFDLEDIKCENLNSNNMTQHKVQ
jgi:hypothetical protein